ncbi:TIGR02300 family protein [Falsigemmobacter intermedius]|uniref:TIGR02300 family protein n=1 Tax=Falsigemmobacter intermedius TaxID=1553448 RepID=A0A3S3VW92_9RHOB|nr:TIGR02300 family protein [Falsigemmobacter intermedius]RWY43261.1 TIGR02300 family protein [Falsigemmobacter intermedius]
MPKAEWGTKRICPTTGKRFYDLNRNPIVSPYTGEIVDIETVRRKAAGAIIAQEAKSSNLLDDELDADDLIEADADDADIDEELLEDDDETVSLDDLADVAGGEDEN